MNGQFKVPKPLGMIPDEDQLQESALRAIRPVVEAPKPLGVNQTYERPQEIPVDQLRERYPVVAPVPADTFEEYFTKDAIGKARFVSNVFGDWAARALYGDSYLKMMKDEDRMRPALLTAEPSEPSPGVAANWAIGERLGHLDHTIRTILQAPHYEKQQALRELTEEIGLWAAFVGKTTGRAVSGLMPKVSSEFSSGIGNVVTKLGTPDIAAAGAAIAKTMGGAGHAALKQIADKALFPPRMVVKALNKILPPELRQGIMHEAWETIALPLREIPVVPSRELRKAGKTGLQSWKSIAEVMQPAVERLEKIGVGKTFRETLAKRQLISEAGQKLGNRMLELTPSERFDALRMLKGEEGKSAAARSVVREFRKRLAGLDLSKEYRQEFNRAMQKAIKKIDVPEMDDPLAAPVIESFFESIGSFEAGKGTPKAMQKALDDVIGNPHVGAKLQSIAIDLKDLPANTPEAVARAARTSYRNILTKDLILKGTVSAVKEEADWVLMPKRMFAGWGALTDLWAPRDVWLELRALQEIPKLSRRAFTKWFMTPWKTSKVILRPATHMRNTISNLILNDWGGLPFYRMDVYTKAFKELKNKGKLWKEFQNLTGTGGTFTMNEVIQMEEGLKHGAHMFDKALSMFDRAVAKPRQLYNAEEQWFKLAKYMWNKSKGMEAREAALDAMKWTFNYGEVTRMTALTRSTIAPFFTWQSKVIPLMAETAVKHPVRFGKWILFYQQLQNMAISHNQLSDQQWEYVERILPDYIRDGQFLLMPWKDEKGRLQLLNLTYMIPGMGDISEMYANPAGWMFGTPLVGIGGALQSRTRYSGAPLYHDWETPGMKFSKATAYVWQQLMPSWLPLPFITSGQDQLWTRIWDAIQNNPDAYTPEQIMAAQFGFKITPIDVGQMSRRREALTNIRMSEIDSALRSELRGVVDPRKREKLVNKYAELRRKLVTGK